MEQSSKTNDLQKQSLNYCLAPIDSHDLVKHWIREAHVQSSHPIRCNCYGVFTLPDTDTDFTFADTGTDTDTMGFKPNCIGVGVGIGVGIGVGVGQCEHTISHNTISNLSS